MQAPAGAGAEFRGASGGGPVTGAGFGAGPRGERRAEWENRGFYEAPYWHAWFRRGDLG
jgi:hypothetical protein